MRKSTALGLAGFLITSGCNSSNPGPQSIDQKTAEYQAQPSFSMKEHPVVNETTYDYQGYKAETRIIESKWGSNLHKEYMYSLQLSDIDKDGKLIAKIYAGTRFGSDSPFLIAPNGSGSIIPEGHPFSKYTPEEMETIYNQLQKINNSEFKRYGRLPNP